MESGERGSPLFPVYQGCRIALRRTVRSVAGNGFARWIAYKNRSETDDRGKARLMMIWRCCFKPAAFSCSRVCSMVPDRSPAITFDACIEDTSSVGYILYR